MSSANADPRLRQAPPQSGKTSQTPPPATPHPGGQPQTAGGAAAQNAARDQRADLFEAVTTQREQVLSAFDTQRQAILKAVADQRDSMTGSVRLARSGNAATPPPGQGAAGAAARPAPTRQELVAADIVVTLKAMVSEEVRTQLLALLDAAAARERALRTEPQRGN